ncbi:MAG: enoyl-CoA hydratase-related protein [Paracoccaceae bacterium]
MSEAVTEARHGRVTVLTLNRPETRNALSKDVVAGLVAGLERAQKDQGVSAVVIAAEGKSFSSGGNLNEIKAMTTTDAMSDAEIAAWYRDGIQRIPRTMAAVDVVTVAAVNGHAVGAGCDLAAMCDLRICGEDAVFAESFLRVGLIPGDGGGWFLPRVVGPARAREMLFTGAGVPAEKALAWGLATAVVPNDKLLDSAMKYAEAVAEMPPGAVREAKRLMRAAEGQTLDEHLEAAAWRQAKLQQLDDHREAVDAILEKRKPSFAGR